MADQPFLASNSFDGDGSTVVWEFSFEGLSSDAPLGASPYIEPEDVKAQLITGTGDAQVIVPQEFTFETGNSLRIEPAVPSGTILRIYRETENRFPLVNYQDLQAVGASDLDLANRQAVYIVQEARDAARGAGNITAEALAITLGNAQAAADAAAAAMAAASAAALAAANAQAAAEAAGSADALRAELASATGAAIVGRGGSTVDDDLTALEEADEGFDARLDALEVMAGPNLSQPLMSRSSKVLSDGKGVVVLGDSISAGAYFGNAHTQGWPNLLAKAINHQFGSRNLGAMPMDSLYNVVTAYNTDQLHAVTWVGDWGARVASPPPYDFPVGNVGIAAGSAVNGKTVTSSASGAYVEIVVPSMNALALIYYVGRPGGGTFNVTVNGVAAPALNTADTAVLYNKIHAINTPDNGQGWVTIRLTKADANPTELQSVVQYRKVEGGPFDHFPLMNVCNFSVSGRQLHAMTEVGIIAATNCACLIMALGYNDRFAETDDAYYATYLQRVNWIIQYANINDCLVVVPDFAWYSAPTSRVRTQLRRIAAETKGIYIPFPDKFFPEGHIVPDTTPAASVLVSDMQLFADNAHPSQRGNQLIFNQIALALGLPCHNKRLALTHDMPFPLQLQGSLRNAAGGVSSISRTPNGFLYSLGVTENGGGTIASGSPVVAIVPPKFALGSTLRATSVPNNFVGTALGAKVDTAENGAVTAVISTATSLSCSYTVGLK
jgi:lysophospholipase L1-like esterase